MRRPIVFLAIVAIAFSSVIVGRFLGAYDLNPTTTIKFGEVFTDQNQYAEELLGDVVIAPKAGHDGKFFFSQAMDPFYFEPDVHAVYLDRPTYRAQRMAYPTLASLGGLLTPNATAWGLIVVNVVAMAVGTVFTGLVANRLGLSWIFGLAFMANLGLIVDLTIDGSGIVAMAAMMAGVYYVMERNFLLAAIALSIAALSRETMLIAAAGLIAYLWHRRRSVPWVMWLPFASVATWWLYVHWRLEEGLSQDTQALGVPFVGFARAFQGWIDTPGSTIDLVVGSLMLIAAIFVVVRSVRSPTALGWAISGFALLGVMLSEPVWAAWFDSSRALAPVATGFILLAAGGSTEVPSSAASPMPAPARLNSSANR